MKNRGREPRRFVEASRRNFGARQKEFSTRILTPAGERGIAIGGVTVSLAREGTDDRYRSISLVLARKGFDSTNRECAPPHRPLDPDTDIGIDEIGAETRDTHARARTHTNAM